jgi:hypothetical protein
MVYDSEETLGLDFMDFVLEVEAYFGIRFQAEDLRPTWELRGNDCTVGELHDLICRKCIESGVKVPRSSWNRVRICIVKSAGVDFDEVKPAAWLRKDLGFD